MSNATRRRFRLKIDSCWNATSRSPACVMVASSVRTRSSSVLDGVGEVAVNSTQKRCCVSAAESGTRDDKRSMRSMFKPAPARMPETRAMCPAVIAGPSTVMMKRRRDCADTHVSYSSDVEAENCTSTPRRCDSSRRSVSSADDRSASGSSTRMPNARPSWMTAWPMSSTRTS